MLVGRSVSWSISRSISLSPTFFGMTFFLYLILSTLKPLIAAIASGREDFNGHEGGG